MIKVDEIANLLVNARLNGGGFAVCPFEKPESLEVSYQIQNAAIKLWPGEIAGWKIGRLAPDFQEIFKTERLSGPIFRSLILENTTDVISANVFSNGFAAVEAEYIFEISKDSSLDKFHYTQEEAIDYIGNIYAGVEMAGSPIFDINSYGPAIIASDFGNNFGLILGPKLFEVENIDDLSKSNLEKFCARTFIDGVLVGEGGLFAMPNGPLQAIAWLLGHVAKRGMPLKKGMLISTGAVTGVHDIKLGQNSKVEFFGNSSNGACFQINTQEHKGFV